MENPPQAREQTTSPNQSTASGSFHVISPVAPGGPKALSARSGYVPTQAAFPTSHGHGGDLVLQFPQLVPIRCCQDHLRDQRPEQRSPVRQANWRGRFNDAAPREEWTPVERAEASESDQNSVEPTSSTGDPHKESLVGFRPGAVQGNVPSSTVSTKIIHVMQVEFASGTRKPGKQTNQTSTRLHRCFLVTTGAVPRNHHLAVGLQTAEPWRVLEDFSHDFKDTGEISSRTKHPIKDNTLSNNLVLLLRQHPIKQNQVYHLHPHRSCAKRGDGSGCSSTLTACFFWRVAAPLARCMRQTNG